MNTSATPDDNRKAALADARRTLESAAHFTRGGGEAAPGHDADHASRAGRIEAEQRRLIQWAKENGKLGPVGGATPSEYLDRIALQNQIFEDDIRLERVVENEGKPIIITCKNTYETPHG